MASIDGLVSGLDTTTIVSQLMQLERQPQTRLQAKKATVESAIGALRNLNTKLLAVSTAASTLMDRNGWAAATATSSDTTKVSVTATAGAAPGSLSFGVKQLAVAGSRLSDGFVTALTGDASMVVAPGTTLHVSKGDGASFEISSGDGSLAAVMKAVNASSAGVSATAVQLRSGEYRLKLESTTTGAQSHVKVGLSPGTDDGLTRLGTFTTLTTPADAVLVVGGVDVVRASNTVTDLLSGVTLTLTKQDAAGDPATTVSVKADPEKVAAQVSALVDAVNAAVSDIRAVTGYNLDTGNKGKLYGDAGVRGLRDRLLGSISGPGTAAAGVSLSREGVVTFDKAAFLKALEADPAKVERVLGAGTPAVTAEPPAPDTPAVPGLAARLHDLADGASRSRNGPQGPGLMASAITSRERQISSLKASISNWDNRLEQREATLKRQYAALEKALGASQSQGQWLAGQIAGLPRWS